jgi:HD-GYP domain-containing protein (c-di-GMP phosphodiesterase class II)
MRIELSVLCIIRDPVFRQITKTVLSEEMLKVQWEENGGEVPDLVKKTAPDVLIFHCSRSEDRELVRKAKQISPATEIIVVVPSFSMNLAREAIEAGAYDFIFRSVEDIERLPFILRRVQERKEFLLKSEKILGELKEKDQKIDERTHELRSSMKALSSLIDSARAINSYKDTEELLQFYVQLLSKHLYSSRTSIMLISKESHELVIRAAKGVPNEVTERTKIPMGEGIAGWVAKTGEPLFVRNIHEDQRFSASPHQLNYTSDSFISLPVISVLAIPIKVREEVLGVINLTNKENGASFSYDDFNLATVITAHMASALDNINLRDRLEKGYLDTIATLIQSIEAKDSVTAGHSERVTQYAVLIAERTKLGEECVRRLRLAGSLHDIGKIGIDERILGKKGKLSQEEMRVMQEHPVIGFEILAPLEFLKDIRTWILQHHEYYAGGGYPSGKPAKDMKLESRIITVADAFDAMTSDRPYRAARSFAAAFEELRRCAGTQFDPYIVEMLIAALAEKSVPHGGEAPRARREDSPASEMRLQ